MSATLPPSIEDLLAHASFVRAVARAAVRGDHDVDDVVQATWLASLERGPRHGDSPRGWLATVARNAARGLKRGEGRRRTREARVARPEGLPSTSEIVAKEEVRRKLLEAVLGLAEPYRSALLLRYYEDLPPREVAARLDVPVETARTRVKRGLKLLRERLDDGWDGDRRAWAVAVAPLAGAGLGGAAQAAGAGLFAKAAAAVLALGLLGSAGWYAFPRAQRPAAKPDPVELASADDADDGPRLRGAADSAVRGGGAIVGTVTLDAHEGEVTVSAARIGGIEMLDQRRMMANPKTLLSPPLAGDVVATATLAADGTFRLGGLARGLYFVTARDQGGRARTALAFLLADRGEAETTLDLRRGPHALTGRVTHADGTPCTGWIYVQRVPEGPVASASWTWPQGTVPRRLAQDGAFRFEHLRPGKVALVVVEPGVRLLRQDEIVVPSEAPLEIVLGSTETKRGRVVDAATGEGIAGAQALVIVRLRGDASVFFAQARAGGDGTLEVPDLGRGIDALVTAGGYAPAQAGWDADETEITIRLDRVAQVRGRVLGEDGTGLEGVAVHAFSLGSRGLDRGGVEATTDAEGRYHLPAVPPGEIMVFAHGGGTTSPRLAEVKRGGFNPFVHAAEAGATLEVDLAGVPAGAVEGRLTGPDGEGLAGAYVQVVGEPWPDLRGPGGLRPGLRSGGLPPTTDADGRFVIPTVLPGDTLQVVARTPDGGRVESEPFALAGGATHTVTLTAGASQRVEVRVVEEDGTPVAGVRVLVVRVGPDGHKVRSSAGRGRVTDAEGRLRAGPLSTSDVAVTVDADAYLDHEPVPITAAHRAGDEPLEIVLSRGLTIAGRVVGPQGLDLTTVTVDLEAKGSGRSVRRSVEAEADGRFRFEVLPERTYEVTASAGFEEHGWKARARVEDGEVVVRLALARGARLVVHRPPPDRVTRWTIHVRGPDGETVARASQREFNRFEGQPWHYSGSGRGRTPVKVQTHVSGTEELYVEIFAAEDEDRRPLPFGAALVLPRDLPAGGGEHTVTLSPEKRVRGRVVGPDGEGVAGVPVRAFPHFGTHQLPLADHDPHSQTRTRSDGTFDLRHLGAFAYELRLDLPDAYAPHEGVRVQAGDEDVVVRLRGSTSARIQIRDERGRPVAGAHVQLTHASRTVDAGTTDAEGVVVARGLDPDLGYRVTARVPGNQSLFLPRTLEDQAPGEIELVLPAAHGASGVVVDGDGRPLPYARVYRKTSESGWETHFADERGRFALGGLPAGDLVLMVSPVLSFRWFEGAQHAVKAPDTDLRLVARLGAGIRFRLPADMEPENVSIRITDEESEDSQQATFHYQMIKRRSDTIHGLDPDHRYALYALADGHVFLAGGLRPGPEVVDVALAPWRTILVRLDVVGGLPEGLDWKHANVQAEGPGWHQYARRIESEESTWEIRAVPPGPCTVKARLEKWKRHVLTPEQRFGQRPPPERVGRPYAAEATGVTANEVRLTLRARIGGIGVR